MPQAIFFLLGTPSPSGKETLPPFRIFDLVHLCRWSQIRKPWTGHPECLWTLSALILKAKPSSEPWVTILDIQRQPLRRSVQAVEARHPLLLTLLTRLERKFATWKRTSLPRPNLRSSIGGNGRERQTTSNRRRRPLLPLHQSRPAGGHPNPKRDYGKESRQIGQRQIGRNKNNLFTSFTQTSMI